MRLYSLTGTEITSQVPEKNTEWRDSCATTLMMTVSALMSILCIRLGNIMVFSQCFIYER